MDNSEDMGSEQQQRGWEFERSRVVGAWLVLASAPRRQQPDFNSVPSEPAERRASTDPAVEEGSAV